MIQALIGPITELAGGWLKGKADKSAAEAKLKLTEAETKSKILLSKETSVADWERIMATGSQSSWKDEFFSILLAIPMGLCFCGEWGRTTVEQGFIALQAMPDFYQYFVGCAIAASFGIRGAAKFWKK